MKNILCLTDFSDASTNALQFGLWFASEAKARITLLHVVRHKSVFAPLQTNDMQQELERRLDEATKKLMLCREEILRDEAVHNVHCDYRTAEGNLTEVVKNLSRTAKYDLVITGTTGITGDSLEDLLIGSKTLGLIEDLEVPVLAIPRGYKKRQLHKLVFGTDFQPRDQQVAAELIALGHQFNAHLHLLHVNCDNEKAAEKQLLEFTRPFAQQYDHLHFNCIKRADAEVGVLTFAKEIRADLIVLTGKDYNFFEKLFHQSVTELVAYQTEIPLLVYPAAWKMAEVAAEA